MKSETFVWSRFWTYFKYDLRQTIRNHVKASVLIGLAGLILYVIVIAWNAVFSHTWKAPGFEARMAVFALAFFALELYQTRTYGYITEKRRGSSWLMIPASTLEKWLSMMIMTLIVIPVAFFAVYGAVDGILSLLDPTYGASLVDKTWEVLSSMNEEMVQVNGSYDTSWSAGLLIWPLMASFCLNFLYYLLCGISFKRNKLLWAFGILFVLSLVFSFVTTSLSLGIHVDFEDPNEAEINIRSFLNIISAITTVVALCLAGGIFWRLKTLKH